MASSILASMGRAPAAAAFRPKEMRGGRVAGLGAARPLAPRSSASAPRPARLAVCALSKGSTPKRDVKARAAAGSTEEDVKLTGGVDVPEGKIAGAERAFNKFSVDLVVKMLDYLYEGETYSRFYVLETIARVPYFSYMSVLHLYESLGWWRRADYLSVHFAETWNELHHLLIMEAMGGDKKWFDRFFAQHTAVLYFWVTCVMYLASPRMAYNFMEQVETHAFDTYDKFLKTHGDEIKGQPAPKIARDYYQGGALYMFDEFQTARTPRERRPKVDDLYDVFVAIRDDEAEHCKTMRACQTLGAIRSPHMGSRGGADALASMDDIPANSAEELAQCAGVVDCVVQSFSTSRPSAPAMYGEDEVGVGGDDDTKVELKPKPMAQPAAAEEEEEEAQEPSSPTTGRK